MKRTSLTLSILLLFTGGVWGENHELSDEDIEQLKLNDIKDATQLSCNYDNKRYVKVGSLSEEVDKGEGTDYWYIKENTIYSKDADLDSALVIEAWRKPGEVNWRGKDSASGLTINIIVDENQIKIFHTYDEYYLVAKGINNMKKTVRGQTIDRNSGRYRKVNERWEKTDSYIKDTAKGYCTVIDPKIRKF